MKKVDSRLAIAHHAMLVGANFERADLRGFDLRGANLTSANFRGADLTKANLRGATLVKADLSRACLHLADFSGADLTMADMSMSYAKAANFSNARMWAVVIRYAMHKNALYIGADLTDSDFVGTCLLGARFDNATLVDVRNMDRAIFTWYIYPGRGAPSYDPIPGWSRMRESIMGGISFRENAARGMLEKEVSDEKPSTKPGFISREVG